VPISSCRLNLSPGLSVKVHQALLLPYYWSDPCLMDRVAGDVWRIGVRQPVNDGAVLRQRIQNNVKCGYHFRGLREAGAG
jgi:hypothetical protein